MTQSDRTRLSISDTAYWIAAYRAAESARSDALFHDPYALKLAGEGCSLPRAVPSWALVTRTKLIDDMVLRALSEGTDRVLNLAAGLDTRPYRLPLPAALSWIEGWRPLEVHSLLKSAARYKRLPTLALRFASSLPEPKPDRLGLQPWGGVVRLARA